MLAALLREVAVGLGIPTCSFTAAPALRNLINNKLFRRGFCSRCLSVAVERGDTRTQWRCWRDPERARNRARYRAAAG